MGIQTTYRITSDDLDPIDAYTDSDGDDGGNFINLRQDDSMVSLNRSQVSELIDCLLLLAEQGRT